MDGRSACSAITLNELDFVKKGRLLLTYAEMLKTLHAQGLVAGDNAWENVIIQDDDIRFCDPDTICSLSRMQSPMYALRHVHHPQYMPREFFTDPRLPFSFAAEVECFAHMVHYAMFGSAFRDEDNDSACMSHEAAKNKRTYDWGFRKELPRELEKVVSPVLFFPRDASITADNFVQAIKKDFGL